MYAYEVAFGKVNAEEEQYGKYRALNFPEKIRDAIDRMENYEPDFRNKARQMTIKMFDNLQTFATMNIEDLLKVSTTDKNGTKTETTDWSSIKEYTDNSKNISSLLPELIKQLEEGFGVTDVKKKERGQSAIERFHASQKND